MYRVFNKLSLSLNPVDFWDFKYQEEALKFAKNSEDIFPVAVLDLDKCEVIYESDDY